MNQKKIIVLGTGRVGSAIAVDLTARFLFKKWKLNPGEEDFTVMRITIEGKENGKPKTCIYDLYDRSDRLYTGSHGKCTKGKL